jgi:tetrahydromethanopterin S-methyltransferase subunit G
MSEMSEAARLLLDEKDKQLSELKERMSKLEEKLETKDT